MTHLSIPFSHFLPPFFLALDTDPLNSDSLNSNSPHPFSHLGLDIDFSEQTIHHIRYIYLATAPATDRVLPFTNKELLLVELIKHEFQCYFMQADFQWSLSHDQSLGSIFQKKVWHALTQIPVGEVVTYGTLAKELQTSARAVGNACRQNFFPLLVPCHRVVSQTGIGGYAGDTLETQKGQIPFLKIKQWLLAHEQARF